MLIYFTSGTTGEPKMVLHNHGYPLGHMVTARLWQDVKHNDLHFTVSDTGWAKCAWGKIFGQWIEGACIFVYHFNGKFQATEVLPLLEKYQITTFCCPPTIYRMLILADLEKFDLSSPRHCTSAGEPLNPEVIRVWKVGTGLTICEGYGQSETACCVAVFPTVDPRPGSMGKPSPGWRIEIHDDEGTPLAITGKAGLPSAAPPVPRGCLWNTLTTLRRIKSSLSKAGITRATRSAGTMTGTSGLSAGATMLSRVPGTASGRLRSRVPCSNIPLCRKPRSSGRPTGSGA
jgi:acetyl-CoA synthetase